MTTTAVTEVLPEDEAWEEVYEPDMCECEIDWNCHLHSGRAYTAIERLNDEWAKSERDPYEDGPF